MCKLYSNHSTYTKDKRKRIKTYNYRKSIHNERQQKRKKGTRQPLKSQKTINKLALINLYLPIVTLNVNGLDSPIKRHRVDEWIKKQDLSMCYFQETYFSFKDMIG